MKILITERVYETLSGLLLDEYCVPGVENAFAEGSPCATLYKDVLDAYARICERLGTEEEDADVEIIINAFLEMNKILRCKMFEYGFKMTDNSQATLHL